MHFQCRPNNPEIIRLLKSKNRLVEKTREQIAKINAEIKQKQKTCNHDFKNIKWWDKEYKAFSSQVKGSEIIKEQLCKDCGLLIQFNEKPHEVCHQCADKMKIANKYERDHVGVVTTHKCKGCGHEYQTVSNFCPKSEFG